MRVSLAKGRETLATSLNRPPTVKELADSGSALPASTRRLHCIDGPGAQSLQRFPQQVDEAVADKPGNLVPQRLPGEWRVRIQRRRASSVTTCQSRTVWRENPARRDSASTQAGPGQRRMVGLRTHLSEKVSAGEGFFGLVR